MTTGTSGRLLCAATIGLLAGLHPLGTCTAQPHDAAPTGASSPAPRPRRWLSVTVDPLFSVLSGVLFDMVGGTVEADFGLERIASLVFEPGVWVSDDFRAGNGAQTGLRTSIVSVVGGVNLWPLGPTLSGPFVGPRVELWFVSATSSPTGVSASGVQVALNVQGGWQWVWHGLTVVPGVGFAYVLAPVRSSDGSVTFPVSGFTPVVHLRLGYTW